MKTLTIQARFIVQRGRIYLMPNIDHPDVDMWLTIDDAEHLIAVCHPDDERWLRDVIAVEQERPRCWRDVQRIEAAMLIISDGATT